MNLFDISSPAFLKDYSITQLENLCEEIRDFLIASVSKTGGHLSSNLGTIELTVALHKVFNSGKDKFLFDVSHQAYTHKILTGRAKYFSTLRQIDGLSGFQRRDESEHDPFEAGHAGTALSTAMGYAVANSLNNGNSQVVAVVGDGSLTNGMCYEALNHIGNSKHKVIIVINDNDMSISKNVGSVSNAFAQLSISKPYLSLKDEVTGILKKGGIIAKPIEKGIRSVKSLVKNNVITSNFFADFGIKYLGVYDGHNLKDMINAFQYAKNYSGSVIIHLKTVKGKGYTLSEDDSKGVWHGVSQFDINTGESTSCLPQGYLTYSAIVTETLVRLAKSNPDLCVITPAMIVGSKLEKFFSMFPERAFDTGISEEHAMTFAAGLALAGKQPFISIYSTFLQRAYDQINHDITRMNLPVVIGIDRAGIVGEDGDTHQGVFDIGILKPLPNLIVAHPKDSNELQNMIASAFTLKQPFAIRYARGSEKYIPVDSFELIQSGQWECIELCEQPEVIVLTYGQDVNSLVSKIEINQYPWWVVNMRFIKPIDTVLLDRLFNLDNTHLVIFESDLSIGGISESVLNYKNEKNYTKKIHVIGLPNTYIEHGSVGVLRQRYKIDIQSVINQIFKIKDNE